MYHLLTGRPPFQGASSTETLDQVRNQDPVPPRRLNGRIPRDLETICLTCLEKAPNRRYRSAFTLASDLHLWLDGRPIKARRVSPMGTPGDCAGGTRPWRDCWLRWRLTLITGFVGLFVLLSQAETERRAAAKARQNAEAYEQFSASAADHLGLFLRTLIRHRRIISQREMEASVSRIREETDDLRHRGIVSSSAIGILEKEVGWCADVV